MSDIVDCCCLLMRPDLLQIGMQLFWQLTLNSCLILRNMN